MMKRIRTGFEQYAILENGIIQDTFTSLETAREMYSRHCDGVKGITDRCGSCRFEMQLIRIEILDRAYYNNRKDRCADGK